MRWQNLLIGLFAVALLSVGVLWLLNNYELKEIDAYSGYKGEARTNSLFASRLLLRRMGVPAERNDGLSSLPDTDTVIQLNTERYTFTENKVDNLLDWVKRGGHLITRARVDVKTKDDADNEDLPETEDRDVLQQKLGIRIGAHQMPDEDIASIQLPNAPAALKVEMDFFNALLPDQPAREYQHDGHTWLIQQPLGKGLVTLASTLDFLENDRLDKEDHAQLLWYLLASHQQDYHAVWLVHQDTLPNLFTLLYRHAWAVLLMFGLLLVFTFWALIPRFGAMIAEPPPERRRLLEHITASGQFLWKQQVQGREQLLTSSRHSIHQLARTRIPGWQWLDQQQQVTALAQRLQLGPAQAARLPHLLQAESLDEADFVQLLQLDDTLRKTT